MNNETLLKQLEKVQGLPIYVLISPEYYQMLLLAGAFDSGEFKSYLSQGNRFVPLEIL